jgi:hypothetical protein
MSTQWRLHDSRDTVQAAPPKKQNRRNASVATIVVQKASRNVRAYDKDGKLLSIPNKPSEDDDGLLMASEFAN